jgi:hypothetical protein
LFGSSPFDTRACLRLFVERIVVADTEIQLPTTTEPLARTGDRESSRKS